jgi:hypothetical protein
MMAFLLESKFIIGIWSIKSQYWNDTVKLFINLDHYQIVNLHFKINQRLISK